MNCIISLCTDVVALAFLLIAESIVNNKWSTHRVYPFIFNGVVTGVILSFFASMYCLYFGEQRGVKILHLPLILGPSWVFNGLSIVTFGLCMFCSPLLINLKHRSKMEKILVCVFATLSLVTSGLGLGLTIFW